MKKPLDNYDLEEIAYELKSLALLVGSLLHLKDVADDNLHSYTLYFLETEILKRAEKIDPNNSKYKIDC